MPTVPPAPASFNGYDENHLGSPRTRTATLPDELSVVGSQMAHAEEDWSLLDDKMQMALGEMVDDAAIQRADEILGAELEAAARWLRALFPREDYLHVARSFGVRVLSGHAEQYVNYAAWVPEPLLVQRDRGDGALRRSLGRHLSKLCGRVFEGHKLCSPAEDGHSKVRLWALQPVVNPANPAVSNLNPATNPAEGDV